MGSPYPAVAERVAAVVQGVHAATSGEAPTLYVDATGVGSPIVDILRAAGVGDLARVVAVFFNHGDRRKVERGEVKLGKAWLVSRMQALLQSGLLHLPRNAEAETLAKELLDYEIRVTEDANDRYGAFRVGAHDDLVTAVGLATQEDRGGGGLRPIEMIPSRSATSPREGYGPLGSVDPFTNHSERPGTPLARTQSSVHVYHASATIDDDYRGLGKVAPRDLRPPYRGRWHVTVDLGDYSGRDRASVCVG